jgi:hypothetical protein
MSRSSGISPVIVSFIGGAVRPLRLGLGLGLVLLTTACSTPTLPSDFPAFHLTDAPDGQGSSDPANR